jgi:hypothetical protein
MASDTVYDSQKYLTKEARSSTGQQQQGVVPHRIIDIQHVVYTNESCQLWYSVRLARQLDVLHDVNK